MHMNSTRMMIMNDPGAEQSSQMFLTWVKARPQQRELRALLLTNSVPQLFTCETGPPAYSRYPRRLESLTIC